MRVLVTGATGFLGANLVRHLLARGDDVRCVVRGSATASRALAGLPVDARVVALDDEEALARTLDGCEGVYHLAGLYDPGPGGEAAMHACHVTATEVLFRAARRAGVRRIVVCSSSVTVGFGPLEAPGDEESPLDADAIYGRAGPLRAYHDTKLRAEAIARHAEGVEGVVVNPDFVVGAWDVKPTSGQLLLTMGRRWVPVYPRGGKCFVDADDVAVAHLRAMQLGRPGRRYLLGTENLPYRDFMRLVAEVVGRAPPLLPLPRGATGLLAASAALVRRVGWPTTLDPHVLRAMQTGRYRSGRRALEELGMPHTPIRLAVEKAWRWFVDHGYVATRGGPRAG